jgi:hypothetical protein
MTAPKVQPPRWIPPEQAQSRRTPPGGVVDLGVVDLGVVELGVVDLGVVDLAASSNDSLSLRLETSGPEDARLAQLYQAMQAELRIRASITDRRSVIDHRQKLKALCHALSSTLTAIEVGEARQAARN